MFIRAWHKANMIEQDVQPPNLDVPRYSLGDRATALARLLDSLIDLPDVTTAMSAACALVAADLTDAGLVLAYRPAASRKADMVLADYPSGIGLSDTNGAETLSVTVSRADPGIAKGALAYLLAWRSSGDRRFSDDDERVLRAVAPRFGAFLDRLIPESCEPKQNALDPETGLWTLPGFIDQADRRFDRLDIEERVGTMFAFGWVRSDGSTAPEASPVVVRNSVACLQEMLRPADLVGRVGPTRIAAWCDGVDHLIAAERADRIGSRLESLLTGSGRHAAIGIASRWPRSGDEPSLLLSRARAGLEQARLRAAAQGRPAVRIWQADTAG